MSRQPCGDCRRNCQHTYCHAYAQWLGGAWEDFRRYARAVYGRRLSDDKFYYAHPDAVRRYLRRGVCQDCPAKEVCHTPCPLYWRWWDARMEYARKKLTMDN